MASKTLLFHISDIHFGLEDDRSLDWVMQEIAEKRPAAVAITGDLTMRARPREFAAACHWIRSLDVPVTVEVGNHDLPYFNLVERFTQPYRRFREIKQLIECEVDLPGLAIVPLKTVRRWQPRWPWSHGWVTDRALDHTLTIIDRLPRGTKVLVACHHPLVEAGTHGKAWTRGGDHALAELAKRNVLATLSGHVHDAFDIVSETPNGPVRMIGAGTLIAAHPLDPAELQRTDLGRRTSRGLRAQHRRRANRRHAGQAGARRCATPTQAGRAGGAGAHGPAGRSAGLLTRRRQPGCSTGGENPAEVLQTAEVPTIVGSALETIVCSREASSIMPKIIRTGFFDASGTGWVSPSRRDAQPFALPWSSGSDRRSAHMCRSTCRNNSRRRRRSVICSVATPRGWTFLPLA